MGANPLRPAINMKKCRIRYCPKASKAERNMGCEGLEEKPNSKWGSIQEYSSNPPRNNNHPTVKPLKLMEYLCELTKTPTGGVVLDPFAGSGTTLAVARNQNRNYIGFELNKEYIKIAEMRIKGCQNWQFKESEGNMKLNEVI